MQTAKKKHRPSRGRLRPEDLLTADGVMRAIGLGRRSLTEARLAGVRTFDRCGRRFYRGKDLIEWLTKDKDD